MHCLEYFMIDFDIWRKYLVGNKAVTSLLYWFGLLRHDGIQTHPSIS